MSREGDVEIRGLARNSSVKHFYYWRILGAGTEFST